MKDKNPKYLVNAQTKQYPTFIRVYAPNIPYVKQIEGYESKSKASAPPAINSEDIENIQPADPYETSEERSIRRTRIAIKDYALCNPFTMFATFTFKSDRQDVQRCKTKMANWLKNQRNRNGKFSYLIVSEFHKDGTSLHFHALIGGYAGKLRQAVNRKTGKLVKQKNEYIYEFPEYKSGFTNVKLLDEEPATRTKVAYYIQKYVTKDMPLFANKNRYWVSKGLKKPVIRQNPEEWYRHIKPTREYKNDFGSYYEFDKGSNPLIDIFMEADETNGS